MKFWLIAIFVSGVVNAAPLPATPGLLPTATVRPILDNDPRVVSGRATFAAAKEDQNIHNNSPYEWSARTSVQRRRVEQGAGYNEWNVGIERTIRLPGKANADKLLGNGAYEEGEARYGEAIHETALELLGLWLDWTHAEAANELTRTQLQIVQDNLAVVEKRVKAGDASKLEASLARAEVAEQRRLDLEASTTATVAWGKLKGRFPAMSRQYSIVPTALPLAVGMEYWRDRILDSSDELRIAQAQLAYADANSARARADRIPDPTVGLYTSSEVGGRERLTGVMLSIPIPGSNRTSRANKAVHSAEISRQEVELRKRELESSIAGQVASANGALTAWEIANAGAAEMTTNAQLTQRAYSLGEADLQLLLNARRQSAVAASTALSAKVAAARAYYTLLVNAHLVWDMEHE